MSMNDGIFKGRRILVTGASGGLGSETARYCAEEGGQLMMVDRDAGGLEKVAATLVAGAVHIERVVDIGNEASVKAVFDEMVAAWGGVDIVLNIAGYIGEVAPLEQQTVNGYEQVYRINAIGTFLTMKYALIEMKKVMRGAIVNVSSTSAVRGVRNESGYGASKAAVIQITKDAAMEVAGTGIRINAVAPGWIETPMMTAALDGRGKVSPELAKPNYGAPGRAGKPREIAEAILFLASERASFIHGEILVVDGGSSC